jgi:hypothetical protein
MKHKTKYIEGLSGWTGYKKSELLEGKYRPIFLGHGLPKFSSKKKAKYGDVRVPASKENIRKTLAFNILYAGYGDEFIERTKKQYKRLTGKAFRDEKSKRGYLRG